MKASSELLALGYRWECERYSPEGLLHDGAYGAMAGLISSIEDFSKYISYHLQAWPPRDEPEYGPIRRSSLREMHHPWNFIELSVNTNDPKSFTTAAYCYGLIWSKRSDGLISVNHTGGLPGFGSNWLIAPEHGLGVVSFANCTYANVRRVNTAIISEIVAQANLKPRELPISKFLAERKQRLITIVLEHNWDITDSEIATIFAENFFLDQSLALRKSTSEELLKETGKILSIGELIPKNQLRGHFDIQLRTYDNPDDLQSITRKSAINSRIKTIKDNSVFIDALFETLSISFLLFISISSDKVKQMSLNSI